MKSLQFKAEIHCQPKSKQSREDTGIVQYTLILLYALNHKHTAMSSMAALQAVAMLSSEQAPSKLAMVCL